MPINILMPALSPTMEKGNLAKWLKKEGDKVKSGDVIAEIETDKATMEVEAIDDGTLAKIVVPEGTADVPVNQLIAVLAGEGEDAKAAAASAGSRRARAEAAGCARRAGSCRGRKGRGSASPLQRPPRLRPLRPHRPRLRAARRVFASPLAQAARQGSRHRPFPDRRLRPARSRHRARRGRREVRQGPEARGGDSGCAVRVPRSRRRCRTSRSARCSRKAATRSCRTTACAAPSRSGSRSRRRPSRIST